MYSSDGVTMTLMVIGEVIVNVIARNRAAVGTPDVEEPSELQGAVTDVKRVISSLVARNLLTDYIGRSTRDRHDRCSQSGLVN